MMDLRSLEIFRAVAHSGSVTQASVQLNRVQSNISTRIRQLERTLDQQLFVRGGAGLTLTPAGQTLLGYAERLLALSTEAADAMTQTEPRGVLRIGAMESTAAARLPKVLARYHKQFPSVQIELQCATAAVIKRWLSAHQIDCAFVAQPFDDEAFVRRKVFAEELTIVMPASFAKIRRLSQLNGKTLVAFEPGCAYRAHLERCLDSAGIKPLGVISLGSYPAILACVAAGTGFAIVPRSVLSVIRTGARPLELSLPSKVARVDTVMAWPNGFGALNVKALSAMLGPVV